MHPSAELLATLLLFAPLAGAVLVWLPGAWARRSDGRVAEPTVDRLQDRITIGTSLGSLVLVLALANKPRPVDFRIATVQFHLDALSIYFLLLVSFVALVASCYAGPCWRSRAGTRTLDRTLFYSLFNLFHFTMAFVPMVSNLVVLWIGIELTTVTSTVLVAAERGRDHFEAAWKYIMLTSTGIIFALLGTLFLASSFRAGTSPTMDWPRLVQMAGTAELAPNLVQLSFLFILIGYGTKAGFAPMHTWLPDAHSQAPYPVSALLSGVLLKSALYAILRFFTITNEALGGSGFASAMLLAVGLLSLVAAVPFILKRNPFKRVLAYHSVEHMGIITVGVGVGGPIAMFGALLHVLNHGVTKSLMFLAYGNVQDNYQRAGPAEPQPATVAAVAGEARAAPSRSRPSPAAPEAEASAVAEPDAEVPPQGVLRAMPWTGSILALGGLALVGSPPFSIFLSEFLILWGAVGRALAHPTAWLVAAIVVFLVSVTLIFGGLVRHLSRILLGRPPSTVRPETWRQVVPVLGLLAAVVVLGLTVPDSGPLDLRGLLDDSVAAVCGPGGCG